MSTTLNAKIPFQPGLALGSIVKGDTIQKMEEYAKNTTKIEKVQKEMAALEQSVKTLTEKVYSIEQKRNKEPLDGELKRVYQLQMESLKEKMQVLPAKLASIQELKIPSFSNVSTGLESPIDFDHTEVAVDSRGFDSITFNSQYIDMNESSQRIQDKLQQSSNSTSVDVGGSYLGVSAKASHSWSNGAMNRIGEIKNQGHASSVLFVNAMVTTRYVRYLKYSSYNLDRMKMILEQMQSSNERADLKKYGITVNPQGVKCIYILTEAVMGGSFSAIITHLKDDHSDRDVRDQSRHSSSVTKAGVSAWGTSVEVGHARGRGSESHGDEIHNQGNLNITIEYISQGVVPQLTREKVVREALKHQDQNLSQPKPLGGMGFDQPPEKRQGEIEKSMYAALNTRKTQTQEEELSIHSTKSVLNAFDDFSGEMVSDSSCGIPIGFNYTILTESFIAEYITRNSSAERPIVGPQSKSQSEGES